MAVIRRDLSFVIEELVAKTDATIFVTNYYNPTAENPQGPHLPARLLSAICR